MQTRGYPTGSIRVWLARNASAAAIEFVSLGVRVDVGGLFLPVGVARLQGRDALIGFRGLLVRDGLHGVARLFDGIGDGHLVGNWTRHGR